MDKGRIAMADVSYSSAASPDNRDRQGGIASAIPPCWIRVTYYRASSCEMVVDQMTNRTVDVYDTADPIRKSRLGTS